MFTAISFPCKVGAAFPIWGLLLASIQDIFYYTDIKALRDASALAATRFIMLGIDCLIGYTLQYYCIAQVGQRVSTGTAQLSSAQLELLSRLFTWSCKVIYAAYLCMHICCYLSICLLYLSVHMFRFSSRFCSLFHRSKPYCSAAPLSPPLILSLSFRRNLFIAFCFCLQPSLILNP